MRYKSLSMVQPTTTQFTYSRNTVPPTAELGMINNFSGARGTRVAGKTFIQILLLPDVTGFP